MEVDLQSLFGLHVKWCAQLYSLAETPHPQALGLVYEGSMGQQRSGGYKEMSSIFAGQ
jgi:hypothetical protein